MSFNAAQLLPLKLRHLRMGFIIQNMFAILMETGCSMAASIERAYIKRPSKLAGVDVVVVPTAYYSGASSQSGTADARRGCFSS